MLAVNLRVRWIVAFIALPLAAFAARRRSRAKVDAILVDPAITAATMFAPLKVEINRMTREWARSRTMRDSSIMFR